MLLAVLAGGGVFILGGTLGGGGVIGGAGTNTVVIAKVKIPLRHAITLDDLDTAKVSGNVINTYSNKNDVVNLIAEVQISKGALISSDMLANDIGLVPSGSAPAYLPLASGYVAMTIPTGEQQGVAGHITVGDYITVIASASVTIFSTGNVQAGPPKIVSKTVFKNVRIIGLGPASPNIQPASGATSVGGGSQGAAGGLTSSLTIELTQCDAEYFTWFLNNTSLKYTLESFHDYIPAPVNNGDTNCPNIDTAQGVSQTQVNNRYHFTSL